MWIAAAYEGSPAPTNADALKRLAKPRTANASNTAWKLLKECRDAGKSLDLELASAEHYLFIRYFASDLGTLDAEELPALYGAVKKGLGPAAQLLKTSDQPVSPPDPAVLKWGNLGVAAGLSDFTKSTGKAPSPKSGKLAQYKLSVEGFYENYSQTTKQPACKVVP